MSKTVRDATIRDAMNHVLKFPGMGPLREAKARAFSAEGDEVSLDTPYSTFVEMLLMSRAYFQFETNFEIVKLYGDNSIERFDKK